jgi:hypothetical protein
MIMGGDRPELPAVAEAVCGIGEECGLEHLEQFFHRRSQQWIDHLVGREEMVRGVAQHFSAQQFAVADERVLRQLLGQLVQRPRNVTLPSLEKNPPVVRVRRTSCRR